MKGVFKGLGLTLAAVAVIAVFAWFCLFVYWDVRIRGAIRTIDRGTTDLAEESRALQTLDSAGCRALRYMIPPQDNSLSLKNQVWRMVNLNHYFFSKAPVDPDARKAGDFLEGCGIRSGDSHEEQRRKWERIRTWWRERGPEYHHWWDLWSPHCRKWGSAGPD